VRHIDKEIAMTDSAHAPPGSRRRPQLTLVPEQATAKPPRRLPILEIARSLRGRSIVRAQYVHAGTKTLFLWELSDGSVIALLRDFASTPCFRTWGAYRGPSSVPSRGSRSCPRSGRRRA
jgi:hypothetical protein